MRINNVGEIVTQHVARGGVALVDLRVPERPREVTYPELDAACNAVARALAARGLGRGDRVALLSYNRSEFLEVLFGSMRVGAVPVPLNVKLAGDALKFICEDAQVRLIFAEQAFADKCPEGIPRVSFDDDYGAFLDPGSFESYAPAPDDPFIQLYTSGSTGTPKGVLLAHSTEARLFTWFGTRPQPGSPLVAAPLYHKGGLRVVKRSLSLHETVVLQPRFEARSFIRAIERHRVAWTVGVPAMFGKMLLERDLLDATDLSSMRVILLGAAPFSDSIFKELRERFPAAKIVNGYGITEGGAPFGPHPKGIDRPPESVGHPNPGVEVKLVDGPSVDEGTLWVRSTETMLGYHNRRDDTAKRIRNGGWIDTGDVMRRDADGFYYFVRRVDDMFVCGGENIYPREVEALLERCPSVLQAVVVAVEHSINGHVPIAFVVLRPGADATEEDVKAWALANGPAFSHPRRVFIERELPMAGTLKIDRGALEKAAALRIRS